MGDGRPIRRAFLVTGCIAFLLTFCAGVSAYTPTNFPIFLSSETVGRYEKLEIISFAIDSAGYNRFDENEIDVKGHFTDPDSVEEVVYGFWYQDYERSRPYGEEVLEPEGLPHWRVRYAPKKVGEYSCYVTVTDSGGTVQSETRSFTVTSSDNPGFVHLNGSDPSYYELGDEVFFGLGENLGWWEHRQGTYTYDRQFDELASAGGRLARVFMNNEVADDTYCGNVEDGTNGLNNYDLDDGWRYDYILDLAREKGLYVRLCLFNIVNFVDDNWDNVAGGKGWPYYVGMGGPCATRSEFFTHETAKMYQKRLFRYLAARYGYATSLHSWELWNEQYNGIWHGIDTEDMVSWNAEMSAYIKSIDKNHLVSTSSQTGMIQNAGEWWQTLDDADGHPWGVFTGTDDFHGNKGGHDMGWEMPYYVDYIRARTQDSGGESKPVMFGEWAMVDYDAAYPGEPWSPLPFEGADTGGISFHNAMWSCSMAGGFGGLLRWYWNYYGTEFDHMYQSIPGFLSFWAGENPANLTPVRNLVYNSDFEEEKSIWSGMNQWRPADASPETEWSIVEQSPAGSNSTSSLRWVGDGVSGGWRTFTSTPSTMVLKPNTTYTISGWIRTQGVQGGNVFLIYTWAEGQSPRIGELSGTNDWTLVSETFTTTAHMTDPNMWTPQFNVWTTTNRGTAWFDRLSVTEGAGPPVSCSDVRLRVHGLRGEDRAYLWIQNREYTWWNVVMDANPLQTIPTGATVTIPGMAEGLYEVEWWDDTYGLEPRAGEPDRLWVDESGVLTLSVPDLQTDVACKIWRDPDSDLDGLPDYWEMRHFGNLDQGPDDDPDNDGLKNLPEFLTGCDPTDPDTDDDRLIDGVETGTGVFVSVFDTGTDPTDPDADNDGLRDGDEVRDLNPDLPGIQNPFHPFGFDTTGDLDNPLGPDTPDGKKDGWNDYDGDGMNNRDEFTFGTDPLDPDSWLELPAARGVGLGVLVAIILFTGLPHLSFKLCNRGRAR